MNTLQYTDDVLQNYTLDTYVILLTNVILPNLMRLSFLMEIYILRLKTRC